MDAEFCKGCFVYINAWRNITTDPIENNHLAVCDETYLVSPDDYLASDLFMPGARLMHYGLSDHNAAKHRCRRMKCCSSNSLTRTPRSLDA